VKLTISLKLTPAPEQADALRRTLERCNAACDWLSEQAWQTQTFRQFDLHKLAYRETREHFGLGAQAAVRCIAKVADAYKAGRKVRCTFRRLAGQPYDLHILRFASETAVSVWTLDGRLTVPFVCGDYQRKLLPFRKGEVDLLFVRGVFYLAVVCDVPDGEAIDASDVIGVDLGIVNVATDSDGTVYSGEAVEQKRRIFTHRRRNLQKKGHRTARRKLRRISGTQARYQRDINHQISKRLVAEAQRTDRAIALEDLQGIRERVTARRRQRARLANWSFFQLRSFISYKAVLAGVPVILVDPRNTSRTCPDCGCIDRANRPTQSQFSCVSCGFAGVADHIAARNIRARALVSAPMVTASPVTSSRLQPGVADGVPPIPTCGIR